MVAKYFLTRCKKFNRHSLTSRVGATVGRSDIKIGMEYSAVLYDEFTEILDGGFCITIDLRNYEYEQGGFLVNTA